MNYYLKKFIFKFLNVLELIDQNLSDFKRRSILISIDSLLLIIAPLVSFYIIFENISFIKIENYSWIFISLFIVGLIIFKITDLYKSINKYLSSNEIYKIAIRNFIIILITITIGYILKLNFPENKNIWLLIWLFLTTSISIFRFTLRDILLNIRVQYKKNIEKIVIYGAGSAGAKLARNLSFSKKFHIKYFIDDSKKLERRKINGITIFNPKKLSEKKQEIDRVLIAIPSLKKKRRREIVANIKKFGIQIYSIPSLQEITEGDLSLEIIKPIEIEDLLGRDPVPPDKMLLKDGVFKKSICITGAGGSIGSEICNQIINYNPVKIILIEQSELNLYNIYEELKLKNTSTEIIPVLGNCTNFAFINKVIKNEKIDLIFHSAAYKHVPLVEQNPLQGIFNNAFSTKNMCMIARKYNIKKFILISTDKAVRPTSVMGASKRLAEIIVQAFANEPNFYSNSDSITKKNSTLFSIVRFGNVLASSGSVVPLFKKQIEKGGPITITDPRIIRYFMTIKEAALLVIQASSLSKGGEVFLLDMGKPVKILELAKQMIKLSGYSEKRIGEEGGDIEIKVSGLRPGEKLYEELLIDGESKPTKHPLIFKAREKYLDPFFLTNKLDKLEKFLHANNEEKSLLLLKDLVPEWVKSI